MWVFYIELATGRIFPSPDMHWSTYRFHPDFLKLTTYLVFFTIIITFYGLPLNIVRDVYLTARSFITRLRALHRYQTATRNMDQRYPNATEEEMSAMSDRTCIICREEMSLQNGDARQAPTAEGPNMTPKKLPCGHIFHFYCLRSWLERQQSCPTWYLLVPFNTFYLLTGHAFPHLVVGPYWITILFSAHQLLHDLMLPYQRHNLVALGGSQQISQGEQALKISMDRLSPETIPSASWVDFSEGKGNQASTGR